MNELDWDTPEGIFAMYYSGVYSQEAEKLLLRLFRTGTNKSRREVIAGAVIANNLCKKAEQEEQKRKALSAGNTKRQSLKLIHTQVKG